MFKESITLHKSEMASADKRNNKLPDQLSLKHTCVYPTPTTNLLRHVRSHFYFSKHLSSRHLFCNCLHHALFAQLRVNVKNPFRFCCPSSYPPNRRSAIPNCPCRKHPHGWFERRGGERCDVFARGPGVGMQIQDRGHSRFGYSGVEGNGDLGDIRRHDPVDSTTGRGYR